LNPHIYLYTAQLNAGKMLKAAVHIAVN